MSRRAAILAAAVVSGGLQALLPRLPLGLAPSLVVLVPFLAALEEARPAEAFVAALAYTVALGEVAILPWLAPALGPYFGLPAARATLLAAGTVAALALAHGAVLGAALALRPRRAGAFRVVWYAALWASWEALRTYLPPRFPGAVLGASLERSPALLQLASVTGIAGVTAVVVAANAALATLVAPGASRAARLRALCAGVAAVALALVWGAHRLDAPLGAAAHPIRVRAVDPVATDVTQSTLAALVAATPLERGAPPDLLLWPESAITADLARDRAAWRTLAEFVERAGTTLVTGALSVGIGANGRPERFNALDVVRPRHGIESYHKRLLVPLAESWPAFLGAPPAALEPVSPGDELPVLHAGDARFGPLICFEIGDAASARALARGGAAFLVNPTNDVWFRGAEAPHLRWARVRAIETGRPVVRVANAGASVIFDPLGRVAAWSAPAAPVGVLDATLPPPLDTVYVATGEVFVPACALLVALGAAASVIGVRPGRTRVAEAVLRRSA